MANDVRRFRPLDEHRDLGPARAGRAHAGDLGKHRQRRIPRRSTAGGDPYRRKVPTFSSELDRTLDAKVVALGKIRPDPSAFRIKHEPGNPAADAAGNVKYPNVNPLIEMTDMRDAQRSYEANLNIISATRRMIQRTLDILKA